MPSGALAASGLVCALLLAAPAVADDDIDLGYDEGLLSIRCVDARLATLLDEIRTATGMELIVADATPTVRVTTELQAQPVSVVIQRLLEGTGLDYVIVLDPSDGRRVAKMYLESEGGHGARD